MKDKKMSVSAIIGIVFAGLAILLSWIPIINNFAFVLAAVGLGFGIVALVATLKGKRRGKGLAITTVVLSVLAFVIVMATQSMYGAAIDKVSDDVNESIEDTTGDNTEELLGRDVLVDVGTFQSSTDQYGLNTTSLPVKVTNKLSEKTSYNIQIEAVDSNGSRIADDYVLANDLGAGQSQDFKAFQYVEESKLEAMKSATFKIVSVGKS